MARGKKGTTNEAAANVDPEDLSLEHDEEGERLGADIPGDETMRAQERALDRGNVLVTLGSRAIISGKDPHIMSKWACTNRPDFVSMLAVMQPNYVSIFEPERGTRRKPITGVTGEITKFMPVGGKKKHVTVWIRFESTKAVQDALAQIDECEPATAVLFSTQEEIPGVDASSID